MNAKHQFKYIYSDTDLEEYSPVEVTFEMPGTATISQMLRNFEQYLRACGYVFDGAFDIVPEGYDVIEEFENEPQGGCMADFDKECGCLGDSMSHKEYQDQRLEEWNEGVAKLDAEVAKNKWVHGICNPPASDTTSAISKEYYDWLSKVKLG